MSLMTVGVTEALWDLNLDLLLQAFQNVSARKSNTLNIKQTEFLTKNKYKTGNSFLWFKSWKLTDRKSVRTRSALKQSLLKVNYAVEKSQWTDPSAEFTQRNPEATSIKTQHLPTGGTKTGTPHVSETKQISRTGRWRGTTGHYGNHKKNEKDEMKGSFLCH